MNNLKEQNTTKSKQKKIKCHTSYVEDGYEYWTAGETYMGIPVGNGNYEVGHNFAGTGYVGPDYLASFEEIFEPVGSVSLKSEFDKKRESYSKPGRYNIGVVNTVNGTFNETQGNFDGDWEDFFSWLLRDLQELKMGNLEYIGIEYVEYAGNLEAENTEELKKEEFKKACYEAYQLDWMAKNGYSLRDVINELAEIWAEMEENGDPLKGDPLDRMETLFTEFEYDRGFGSGSLYVCKNEFLDTEFQDPEYMDHLFNQMPNSADKKAFYQKHYCEPTVYFQTSDFEQSDKIIMEGTSEDYLRVRSRFKRLLGNNALFTEKNGKLIITAYTCGTTMRLKRVIDALEGMSQNFTAKRVIKAKPEYDVELVEKAGWDIDINYAVLKELEKAGIDAIETDDNLGTRNIIINASDEKAATGIITQFMLDLSYLHEIKVPSRGWNNYMRPVTDKLDDEGIQYIEGYSSVYVSFEDLNKVKNFINEITQKAA